MTPDSAVDRWFPEIAAAAGLSLVAMGFFAPGRITTASLAVLGLISAAYAAKVRYDVGY